MARKKLEDTQPIKITPVESTTEETIKETQSIKKKPKRWRTILLGILAMLLFAIGGGGLGYLNGIKQRIAREDQEVLSQAALHYQLGIQQMDAGNYELARTQLEYVISIYPDFPEVKEKYTEVLVKLSSLYNPVELEIEATPTPDTRGAEAIFNQAVQYVQTQQWALAMQSLQALRDEDFSYHTIEVDGLYFTTLRNRAIELIVNEGNLEEGLYFLAIVEKYMPLDHDARNYAEWARLYLTGGSYWDLDWKQVVNYFGQLSAAFPYLHDGTGWTATDRFLKGSEFYGDQLVNAGQHCEAIKHYQNILNYGAREDIQSKYNKSYLICHPPTPTPEPTPTIDESATEEPPAEPTATPDGGGDGDGGDGGGS